MQRMKYPRIGHIQGSNPSSDDIMFKSTIYNVKWFVTEKMDGSQICFTLDDNGQIHAFNRNTELLLGHSDKQFSILQIWINNHYEDLFQLLQTHILYGEWLFHTHTVYYDTLPDWFLAFGLKDKQTGLFLPPIKTWKDIQQTSICHVPVFYEKKQFQSFEDMMSIIQKSTYGPNKMEGFVLHHLSGQLRCKYVTKQFKDSVDNSRHWRTCTRTQNKLNV